MAMLETTTILEGTVMAATVIPFPLPEPVQMPQSPDAVAAAALQYDRLSIALSGAATTLDLDPAPEQKALWLRGYAKVIRAHVEYTLALAQAGIVVISERDRERLLEVDENLDDLIDTLEWASEKKTDLQALLSENLNG
jgi:hypothetical protein